MLPAMNDEMTYAHLGRSGLLVSRIGLGTMNFGYLADEPASFAVVDAAFDAGITLFDTADVYGGPQSPTWPRGTASRKRPSAGGYSAADDVTTLS
jgi:aryl-alcohol dehydrogenase-like predicted oxidoreductase